jgi:hypothetical protein
MSAKNEQIEIKWLLAQVMRLPRAARIDLVIKIERETRKLDAKIPIEIYSEVLAAPVSERPKWIARANAERLSPAQLRALIRASGKSISRVKPRPALKLNPAVKKALKEGGLAALNLDA